MSLIKKNKTLQQQYTTNKTKKTKTKLFVGGSKKVPANIDANNISEFQQKIALLIPKTMTITSASEFNKPIKIDDTSFTGITFINIPIRSIQDLYAYNLYIRLYAFIILYCILVHKFRINIGNTNNIILNKIFIILFRHIKINNIVIDITDDYLYKILNKYFTNCKYADNNETLNINIEKSFKYTYTDNQLGNNPDALIKQISTIEITIPQSIITVICNTPIQQPLAPIPQTEKQIAKGIENLGNTCYMNAGLQLLYNIGDLRTYFKNTYPQPIGSYTPITNINNTLARFYFTYDKLASPISLDNNNIYANFITATGLSTFEQHDAQEFLIRLLGIDLIDIIPKSTYTTTTATYKMCIQMDNNKYTPLHGIDNDSIIFESTGSIRINTTITLNIPHHTIESGKLTNLKEIFDYNFMNIKHNKSNTNAIAKISNQKSAEPCNNADCTHLHLPLERNHTIQDHINYEVLYNLSKYLIIQIVRIGHIPSEKKNFYTVNTDYLGKLEAFETQLQAAYTQQNTLYIKRLETQISLLKSQRPICPSPKKLLIPITLNPQLTINEGNTNNTYTYILKGCVVQLGHASTKGGGGHYVYYRYNADGTYPEYCFNDSDVTRLSANTISQDTKNAILTHAYVILYERKP